ncbi:entericidin A/B family lipoprotein [Lonepinella sp. MS14437]
MKKMIAVVLSALFVMSLTACETTKGVGKDIQNAGEKMDQALSK